MDVKALLYAILTVPIIVGLFLASVIVGYVTALIALIALLLTVTYYSYKIARED